MLKPGQDFEVLLRGDAHFDSKDTNGGLELAHLEEAKRRGAAIIDIGDLFDAMQAKNDSRSSKRSLLESLLKVGQQEQIGYVDALVSLASQRYAPYWSNWLVLAEGNHETSLSKYLECDLGYRLWENAARDGSPMVRMGYRGWVRFLVRRPNTRATNSIWLYFLHGSGAGGKGLTKIDKRSSIIPDAHIVISGHLHQSSYFPVARYRVNDQGQEYVDSQLHLQVPSYKEDFLGGSGWSVEKELGPKPVGAWWLKLGWASAEANTLRYEAKEAEAFNVR